MISFIKQSLAGPKVTEGSENNNSPVDGVKEIESGLEALDIDPEALEWKETIFDLIRRIRDPEKPESLEELEVVREELVEVERKGQKFNVTVGFVPTVPHCSLATLIGLCLTVKLGRDLPPGQFKVSLYIRPDSHDNAAEVTKQINDKERVSAAMENPNLASTVEECIQEE